MINDQIDYNLKLYELTVRDEGMGLKSTNLFENVVTVDLNELNQDQSETFY